LIRLRDFNIYFDKNLRFTQNN